MLPLRSTSVQMVQASLLLLCCAAPVVAQTVYLRPPGTGFCRVQNASSTTPIKLTVEDLGRCGISQAGQIVLVVEVRGNTAANIHLKSKTDNANLARRVANVNLTSRSFDLLDLAGNPVASNGTYINGGRVGLAQAYELKAHPRLYLDGPNGAITQSVSDTSPGGRANASNLPFVALKTATNRYSTSNYVWGSDISGAKSLGAALRWRADGNSASRVAALFDISNVTQVLGTLACAEEERGCDAPGSQMRDYPSQDMENHSQLYSVMRGEIGAADVDRWVRFLLNDLPWTQGGIDYSDATWTKPVWKLRNRATSGTVTVSGTTVTGDGTRFLRDAAVGDVIVMGHSVEDVYGQPHLITAINSDTSLTINRPPSHPISGNKYMIGPPWNENFYGLLWHQKHYEASILCGGATRVPDGLIATCEQNYGFQAGYDQNGSQNLVLARLLGWFSIGLALCGDDPRACLLLELTNEYFVDAALPRAMTIWTGFSQSTPGYHAHRMYNIILSIAVMTKNSLVDGLDYLAGTDIARKAPLFPAASHFFYTSTRFGYGLFLPSAEDAAYEMERANHQRSAMLGLFIEPQAAESRQYKAWLAQHSGVYSEEFMASNFGEYAWWYFLYNDPNSSPAPTPTTFLYPTTNWTRCTAVYGEDVCPSGEGRYMFTSQQNWTRARTFVAFNGASIACLDHCGDDAGGWLLVAKNGVVLLGPDSWTFMGARPTRGYIEIGGSAGNMVHHYPETRPVSVIRSSGNDEYMSASLDLTRLYKESTGVASVTRQVFHLKSGTQDYIVENSRAVVGSPTSIRGFQHVYLNECGQPSATSCVSLSPTDLTISNTQGSAKLSSRVYGVGGNMMITTAGGSLTNGTYQGGVGYSFRVTICPTGGGGFCAPTSTDVEWSIVHRPSTDPFDTLPPISARLSGVFRVTEILDTTSPKVVMFTSSRQTASRAEVTTTHVGVGQYVISGLHPGWYEVRRDRKLLGRFESKAGSETIDFHSGSGLIVVAPAWQLTSSVSPRTFAAPRNGTAEVVAALLRRRRVVDDLLLQ